MAILYVNDAVWGNYKVNAVKTRTRVLFMPWFLVIVLNQLLSIISRLLGLPFSAVVSLYVQLRVRHVLENLFVAIIILITWSRFQSILELVSCRLDIYLIILYYIYTSSNSDPWNANALGQTFDFIERGFSVDGIEQLLILYRES